MGGKPKKAAPTAAEKASAEIGAKEWNDYVRNFMPLEKQVADDVRYKEGAVRGLAGAANVDSAMAHAGAYESARSPLGITSSVLGRNSQTSAAAAGVSDGMYARETAGLTGLTAFGRKLSADSMANYGAIGNRATGLALAKSDAQAQRTNDLTNLGAAVAGNWYAGYRHKQGGG